MVQYILLPYLYGTVPGMANISTTIFLNKTMGFRTIFNDIHRGYMHRWASYFQKVTSVDFVR
jgi:hypothetical protein